jgi:hypothetical protein
MHKHLHRDPLNVGPESRSERRRIPFNLGAVLGISLTQPSAAALSDRAMHSTFLFSDDFESRSFDEITNAGDFEG